jgi:hypothetical protein
MLFSKSCSEMRPKVDKLNHYPLFIKRKANQTATKQQNRNSRWTTLPGFGGLGPKPSSKSIIGAALAEDVACAESEEGDERASSVAIGDLSF